MKNFEYYYERFVKVSLIGYFPNSVSYTRFLELVKQYGFLMWMFAQAQTQIVNKNGIYFVDSKKLPVCHEKRIKQNKVFQGVATHGKSSTGWFYGLKIHLVCNEMGELVQFLITQGNATNNQKKVLEYLLNNLKGKCFGDKGYIKKLFDDFYKKRLKIITKVRKNMKEKIINNFEKFLLKKRGLIESVNDILMTICDIEHTRHRSANNAFTHVFAALAAYQFLDKKPNLKLNYFLPI